MEKKNAIPPASAAPGQSSTGPRANGGPGASCNDAARRSKEPLQGSTDHSISSHGSVVGARWASRIIGEAEVQPIKLIPHPENWRKHPKAQQTALGGALDEIGWIQRVIVNKRTGHIIDGHLRVELALTMKEKLIPVCYVDLSEDEERLALATFDPLSAMAVADQKIFDALLKNISCDNENLKGLLASANLGLNDPDFQPSSGDDQGNLDNTLIKHVCPRCGHEF